MARHGLRALQTLPIVTDNSGRPSQEDHVHEGRREIQKLDRRPEQGGRKRKDKDPNGDRLEQDP